MLFLRPLLELNQLLRSNIIVHHYTIGDIDEDLPLLRKGFQTLELRAVPHVMPVYSRLSLNYSQQSPSWLAT